MIQQQRFQNVVTKARSTFPLTVVIALLLWGIGERNSVVGAADNNFIYTYLPTGWISGGINLLLCAITVYILIELNNAFSIIGHRSTFHTTVFLCLWASCPFLNHQLVIGFTVLCFMMALYYLFCSYQVYMPVMHTFHLFLFIGLGSLSFPQILFFVPLLYIALLVFKALTFRSFFAGVIGVGLPYWFLFAHAFYYETMDMFYMPFENLFTFSLVDYSVVSISEWVSFAYVLLLFVVSSVYFVLTNYQDKIRVRTYLYFFIVFTVGCVVFLLLQPQHFAIFFALMFISCSVLSGHLFALANTKLSNIFFIVSTVLLLMISICNIWMPLYSFF